MKTLDANDSLHLYTLWLQMSIPEREKMIASKVFGVEIGVPDFAKRTAAPMAIEEHFMKKGWETQVRNLPRSTLSVVRMENSDKKLYVEAPVMPMNEGKIFIGLLAATLENISEINT